MDSFRKTIIANMLTAISGAVLEAADNEALNDLDPTDLIEKVVTEVLKEVRNYKSNDDEGLA